MPGSLKCCTWLDSGNKVDILRFTGTFPDVMIMVTRYIQDMFIKKGLSIFRKDKLNKALKHHRRFVYIAQGHFKNIPIQHQHRFLRAFILFDKVTQTGHQLAEYRIWR